MSSDRALRVCMQVLVLVNLVFVQMTGAAALHWLLPLYALAFAAPLLERHRERLAYRMLWNVGLVCFFLVLLRHVLSADLAFVLEDGLVLAVLCQVHLFNNLRSRQRPDLLFFNAFLIAIITGFMNRGVGFPLVFLGFAPAFVIGLELLSATRGGRTLTPTVTRRLVLDGARRAGVLLAVSLLAFLFWPRDFERKAFFHGRLQLASNGSKHFELGFNEELRLDRGGTLVDAGRPALRVTLLSGATSAVSPLWRGGTLGATEGGRWIPFDLATWRVAGAADEPWRRRAGRLTRSTRSTTEAAGGARVEVVRFEQETERIFGPLEAGALRLAGDSSERLLRPRPDGTIDIAGTAEARYQLTLVPAGGVERGGIWSDDLPSELAPYVELPETPRVALARELATALNERLPAGAEQHERVALLRDYLARTYTYLPPGSEAAPRTLAGFLRGDGGGHCEFFASALGTMLRSLGIPCRVVTGFRSTRWDAAGHVLSFGTQDAHVWVEACDPVAGWYAVDASPVVVETVVGASLWARLQARAGSAWATVTGFDSERRAALFAWLRALPRRIWGGATEAPLATLLAISLVALPLALLHRRRSRRVHPAVRAYRNALRCSKFHLLDGETPRQLLRRARAAGLSSARVQALEAATREHEAARYAT